MNMKPEEITAIIKKQIEDYNVEMNVDDVGTVLEVGDGIAHIYGFGKKPCPGNCWNCRTAFTAWP